MPDVYRHTPCFKWKHNAEVRRRFGDSRDPRWGQWRKLLLNAKHVLKGMGKREKQSLGECGKALIRAPKAWKNINDVSYLRISCFWYIYSSGFGNKLIAPSIARVVCLAEHPFACCIFPVGFFWKAVPKETSSHWYLKSNLEIWQYNKFYRGIWRFSIQD